MGLPEQRSLVDEFILSLAGIRIRLVDLLIELFLESKSWRDADADRFVQRAVPLVEGAQRAAATLTDDFVGRMIADQTGRPFRPHGVDYARVTGPAIRNGVAPERVYRRPYEETWRSLEKSEKRRTSLSEALDRAEELGRGQRRGVQIDIPTVERSRSERRTRIEIPELTDRDRKPLTAAVGDGERRLRSLALTDVELAVTHTARERLKDEPEVRFFRRVLTGAESCGLCVIASMQRYRKRDLLPIHPNCIPSGTPVRARNISAATRRWYTGELAVITTAAGDQVSVTPNHPVLTDHGWVPAGEVRESDYLVRSSETQRAVDGGPDEREAPPLAEDVWRSLTMTFGLVQVPLATEDFHGDGADGEVDVVRADSYFSTVGDLPTSQKACERLLVPGQGGRVQLPGAGASTLLVPAGRATANGVVGGHGLGGSLFGGHLCSSHEAGLRSAATGDVGLLEPASDDVARDPMSVREDVLGDSVLDIVDPELFSRVTHVGRVYFAGHVFNFHTRLGTYEAGGHIVHNCDCVVAPIIGEQDPGRIINSTRIAEGSQAQDENAAGVPIYSDDDLIDADLLTKDVHEAVRETFGEVAFDARQIDYRKILLVEQHGELGPMLTVARHKFTKRRIRDRDLAARDERRR